MLTPIQTSDAPAAIGPYSQAVRYGNLIFTSGQIALDPKTGEMVGDDLKTQAHRVMQNLGAVLQASGTGFDKVIKTTCFLADMADFADFNEVYVQYFKNSKAARSCIAARALPKGALCEVEAIAGAE